MKTDETRDILSDEAAAVKRLRETLAMEKSIIEQLSFDSSLDRQSHQMLRGVLHAMERDRQRLCDLESALDVLLAEMAE